jgi:6-pyruvoyltetrahydropterin/6-carboxytetrahydropterin synthase
MLKGTTVPIRFEFCYGHHLPDYEGKCKHFHGHNSMLDVEFAHHSIEEYGGMVIDFNKIKEFVKPIVEELDHRNLNEILDPWYLPPTAENIIEHIVDAIRKTPIGVALQRVRLYETPNSYAEWRC